MGVEIYGVNVIYVLLIGGICWILYDWVQMLVWKAKYKIKGPIPLPFFGTLLRAFQGKQMHELDDLAYKKYGPVSGGCFGCVKSIHVADVNLWKKLMIKDHLLFMNRFKYDVKGGNNQHPVEVALQEFRNWVQSAKTVKGIDPKPLDMGLLQLQDGHWKHVRSVVTPSYSPGKIKMMINEIKYAANLLVSSLEEKASSGEPVDSKFHFGCYSMDVIAGTAFGIRTDAYKNPDQPFISLAKKVFGQDPLGPALLLALLFPRLAAFLTQYLNVSVYYPLDSLRFFTKLINDIIEDRKSKGDTSRNDLLQLMMNADKESQDGENTGSKKLTHDELLAQGFLVFIAGYETTASLLTFLSYALATHPDIQDRLIEEIDAKIKTDDDVTYDKVMEMPYLDQVICETLRRYPPVNKLNRMTTEHKDVEIDGYWFPKDTLISYSVWQIHHQLGLYPEPEKFDPERFSPEEKQKRDPFTFFPFGHGPRSCIGMRLALLEAKVAVVQVLRKLKFVKIPETEDDLQLIIHTFVLAKNPIKVGVTKR